MCKSYSAVLPVDPMWRVSSVAFLGAEFRETYGSALRGGPRRLGF